MTLSPPSGRRREITARDLAALDVQRALSKATHSAARRRRGSRGRRSRPGSGSRRCVAGGPREAPDGLPRLGRARGPPQEAARRGAPRRPERRERRRRLHEEPLPGGAGRALARGPREERRPRDGRSSSTRAARTRSRAPRDAPRRGACGTARRALLGCPQEEVFVASTGVIGVVLPDAKVRAVLPDAVRRLSAVGVDAASHAILTTDVGPKVAQASFRARGPPGPHRRARQGRRDDPPEHGDDARLRHDGRGGDAGAT